MARKLLFFVFIFFTIQVSLYAQYLETFSTPNKGYMTEFVNDLTGVNWTLSPWALDNAAPNFTFAGRDNLDYFQTTAAGKLESSDLDHEVYWESPLINISAAGTVSFSVDLSWTGFDTDGTLNSCISGPHGINATLDVIKVMYSINGGAYTMIPNTVGGATCATIGYVSGSVNSSNPGSITITKPGLSGNSIRIRVVVNTNVTAEVVTIDNVSIPQAGVTLGCTQPTISAVPSNIVCNGANSGAIKVTASGATPPYNVSWSGPSSENPAGNEIATSGGNYTITGLAAGSYTVTVTDAASCSQTTQVTIASSPISQSAVTSPASCGDANGTIDLSVSGGNPGYTYAWSNGATTQDITAVAGNYMVTVTDNSSPGCTSIANYTIAAATNGAYLETFSVPNKGYLTALTNNFFGVNWTLSSWTTDQPETGIGRGGDDYFQTTAGGKLEGIDTDAEVNWTSPLLNIASSGTVQFSVDLGWTQFDPEDYISVEYSLNGGAYQPIPNAVGGGAKTIQYASGVDISGATTVTKTGISGSTLQIKIVVLSNSNGDVVTIDNVSVPQTVSLCICPTFSGAPANVSIVNSVCASGCTVSGGSITALTGTPCPVGSTLQYQVNGGGWSATLPTYAPTGPAQTIKTRCSCNSDPLVVSAESAPVTTVPGTCSTPVVNAPTVTQPTCVSPTGTIVVNATGAGAMDYSINGGVGWQPSNTFSSVPPGNYNIRVRFQAFPDCFTAFIGNPVVINPAPVAPTWYKDADNDNYSDGQSLTQCTQPNNYKLAANLIAINGDCNDGNAAINPGAAEVCDGVDNNCNGQTDEGCNILTTWYRDKDGDGYGSGSRTIIAVTQPNGYVSNPNDCNDSNADVHSGAPELEDGIDNDCDGEVDEDLPCRKLWYKDADGDGYGRNTVTRYSCVPLGINWVLIGGDCKDNDPDVYPGAPEICDGKNNDCNSDTREDCSLITSAESAKPATTAKQATKVEVEGKTLEATIWPNPARTELMVTLDAFVPNQKLSITMMQVDGKVQQSQSLIPAVKGQQVRLDVSSAAAGFYLLQIKQSGLSVTKRFIIIK